MKPIILLPTLLLFSACTSNAYLETVGAFGDQVEKNVAARSEIMADLRKSDFDRTLEELSKTRTKLGLSSGCADYIQSAVVELETKPNCDIVNRTSGVPGETSQVVETHEKYPNTNKLAASLQNYGSALRALAGLGDAEKTALVDGYASLGKSIINLDAAVFENTQKSLVNEERTGIITGLLGELQAAIFDRERVRLLRRLIVETNPIVQEVTELLQTATEGATLAYNTDLFDRAKRAVNQATLDAENSSVSRAKLEKSQRSAFAAVEALKTKSRPLAKFDLIGQAHDDLAKASKNGNQADLRTALTKIFALNDTVTQAFKDL